MLDIQCSLRQYPISILNNTYYIVVPTVYVSLLLDKYNLIYVEMIKYSTLRNIITMRLLIENC